MTVLVPFESGDMAVQFKPLKLQNPDLFGVSLSGSMGRGDRDRLKELADKCLLNGKVRLVLDMSALGSMGGGGARMIAELQERLVAADGEAVIAGAGATVKRFLDQKFEDHPLTYFASLEEALLGLGCEAGEISEATVGTAVAVEEPEEEAEAAAEDSDAVETDDAPAGDDEADAGEVGAVGFCDDEDGAEMDDLLGEYTVAETNKGRRKDHHYTSLSETMEILGTWSDRSSQMDFSEALKNLLFSQGLAEDVTMLIAKGGLLISPDGYKEIPLDGALATQAEQVGRPMTMLDVQDDFLTEEEISLLEAVDPDMIMPVLRQGVLNLLIFIKKGGQDREYSVAESFAFELFQQILEKAEETKAAEAKLKAVQSAPAKDAGRKTEAMLAGDSEQVTSLPTLPDDVNGILLKMSLDLPEADDMPHFWRLFSRHLQPVMELEEMALLVVGGNHPKIMLGGDNALIGLDCSGDRVQKYFQSMELPVQVANLPATFAPLQKALKDARVNWIFALKDEGQFLGTMFVNGTTKDGPENQEILVEVFKLASRLLVRFENQNDDADIYLELIYRLMAQREKRFYGTENVTNAIVVQLQKLAKEMGFPPDQKRDLIYGCLLRDIGLIDKDDALMGSPADMTPNQWKAYRSHPSEGADMLAELKLSQTVLEVVSCHHERFNGEGFPAGLSGRDIPLAARVVTVVENYVAMVTGAGGLEPRTSEDAADVLRQNLGERYDPDIVGIFLSGVAES